MATDHQDVEIVLEADDPRGLFEGKVRGLRNRRLTAVDYWDVHNVGPEPALWDYRDWHHAVLQGHYLPPPAEACPLSMGALPSIVAVPVVERTAKRSRFLSARYSRVG